MNENEKNNMIETGVAVGGTAACALACTVFAPLVAVFGVVAAILALIAKICGDDGDDGNGSSHGWCG